MSQSAGSDPAPAAAPARPLSILHVLRAPVGGLFRHVVDLARRQTELGHKVGLVVDAATGPPRAEASLATLSFELDYGVVRVPMGRHLGFDDLAAQQAVALRARTCAVDVVHGHGAKGGAYASLLPRGRAIRVYTPHGGSLHYRRTSPLGLFYLTIERLLMSRCELFLFESAYGRDVFQARVGKPTGMVQVVHNGVSESEFEPVPPGPEATDIVFVGELRLLKGVDVLIAALAQLAHEGTRLTATIVGDGPDEAKFRQQVRAAGLADAIRFPGAMAARTAFALGHVLVVPSRAESLPYVVLEAGAAAVPQIATAVGGIGEIFGPQANRLVPPNDAAALARALQTTRSDMAQARLDAEDLQARVRAGFSVEAMTAQVLAAYAAALG
jgi:glycosyltransferase involved in cell wall biosynthesis